MLPPILGVGDVQARYRLRDPRAARSLIRIAGGRRIAGRWLIREDVLGQWETTRGDAVLDPSAVSINDHCDPAPAPRDPPSALRPGELLDL